VDGLGQPADRLVVHAVALLGVGPDAGDFELQQGHLSAEPLKDVLDAT
jgi:hypothetical protein